MARCGLGGETLNLAAGTAEGSRPSGRSSAVSFFRDPALHGATCVDAP
ncbi:hypothetical protein CMUS01_07000 [Colletotrichum musicola]|uniref:Uncharacterized protein n=1 Tax=Colletotrichum musicola TaxID=2175873 RepID=A0A8H6KJL6_9PEZI|nr:hypothetical protein CMUS01_07000 [Colletotrichum musicola]